MSRMNMDPLLTFQDGSHLVISTQCSKDGTFSCALYAMLTAPNEETAYRMLSNRLEGDTCLKAQEYAYKHALYLYPSGGHTIKEPPYLIWHGPRC